MKKLRNLTFVGLMGLLLAGCSHVPQTSTSSSPAPTEETETVDTNLPVPTKEAGEAMETKASVEVEIKGFAFSPKEITVAPGAKITVTNRDTAGHSMTSDDGKSFDTGILGKDKSATVTAPAKPGSYPFHCTPHPNMKATLIVK